MARRLNGIWIRPSLKPTLKLHILFCFGGEKTGFEQLKSKKLFQICEGPHIANHCCTFSKRKNYARKVQVAKRLISSHATEPEQQILREATNIIKEFWSDAEHRCAFNYCASCSIWSWQRHQDSCWDLCPQDWGLVFLAQLDPKVIGDVRKIKCQ